MSVTGAEFRFDRETAIPPQITMASYIGVSRDLRNKAIEGVLALVRTAQKSQAIRPENVPKSCTARAFPRERIRHSAKRATFQFCDQVYRNRAASRSRLEVGMIPQELLKRCSRVISFPSADRLACTRRERTPMIVHLQSCGCV